MLVPYGSPYVIDLDKGRRESTLEDFINITRLEYMMDNIDVMSHIPCEPNDIPAEKRAAEMCYLTLKYSDKPLMGQYWGMRMLKKNIEMAALVFGGSGCYQGKTRSLFPSRAH